MNLDLYSVWTCELNGDDEGLIYQSSSISDALRNAKQAFNSRLRAGSDKQCLDVFIVFDGDFILDTRPMNVSHKKGFMSCIEF